MKLKTALLLCLFFISASLSAQILTREDSLNANLVVNDRTTVISGYGEMVYTRDFKLNTATADLRRNILFLGHKFSNSIFVFSEMELEHALISNEGGVARGGELAMEQLFIKFNFNPSHYMTAGLFIPRLGIINENHLPTTFNGNDRPFVEQLILPSTWREIGVGFYGPVPGVAGLNYSVALLNGLDGAKISGGNGLNAAKGSGFEASAGNLAVTGALLHYHNNLRSQVSYYYGGAAGLTKREADSLQLGYGSFGTPVQVMDANFQYLGKSIQFKALGTAVNVVDASALNRAYATNAPEWMFGAYGELAFDVLAKSKWSAEKQLFIFARYEWLDMNAKTPENGIENPAWKQSFVVAGVSYKPTRGVVVKADYVHRTTGTPNEALVITPFPQALPYYTSRGYLNLGVAYSF